MAPESLLPALGRALEIFREVRHPFVPGRSYSYVVPPAGVRVGAVFTLPDGREVDLSVTISHAADVYHVEGGTTAEEETLVDLTRRSTPDRDGGVRVFERYVAELAGGAVRLIDQLLEEITAT